MARRPGFESYQDEKGGWHCGCEVRSGKNKGKPCQVRTPGPTACRAHGPSAGRPIIHGRRSKYRLGKLAPAYEEALADEGLTSLREDIAAVEMLVAEAVEKIGNAEGCPLCAKALGHYEDARAAAAAKKPDKANEAFALMHGALRAGAEGEGVRMKALALQEHKRRLTGTENRREADHEAMITARQANVLIAGLEQLARECITELEDRRRFAVGLAALFGLGSRLPAHGRPAGQ